MNFAELEKKVAAYTGPKIGFVLTGGGIGVAQLPMVIGASKLIHAIHIPYAFEETARFITEAYGEDGGLGQAMNYEARAVCEASALILASAAEKTWSPKEHLLADVGHGSLGFVVCTAATTTSRWRRGDNHAWIGIVKPGFTSLEERVSLHHLKLDKLTEEDYNKAGMGYVAWKRRDEDRRITEFILNQVFEVLGKE